MDKKYTLPYCNVKYFIAFFLLFLTLPPSEAINYRLTQPQIYVDDGHIYFIPAEHRNLVLVANGTGKILFNDYSLDKIVSNIKNSSRDIKNIKRIFGSAASSNVSTRLGLVRRISRIEQQIRNFDSYDGLDTRITNVERQILLLNTTTNSEDSGGGTGTGNQNPDTSDTGTGGSGNRNMRALRRRITTLERTVRTIASNNPCNNSPCQNSGTCIPTIFGAFCYCPPGWEGDRCQFDVNECNNFAGSGLGCQNGAQCVNQPGTYQCQCRSGWVGIHCTQRSGDCSSGPAWELCGHGICVNQHTGSRPYTCICEQGWKTDGTNPACTVDIDECNGPHTSCSKNPLVTCINTPGSFHCGPCPAGYTGNGFSCSDVNECLVNNGGCSFSPMVQCINTIGSRTCGECPPGYIGNGMMCQYVGMCQVNNGGCHPLARCVENPVIGQSYVQCLCPAGYTGIGMGLHGCFPYGGGTGGGGTQVGPISNPCGNNPCVHGSCTPNGQNYICNCYPGYMGQNCNLVINPCLNNPCQNSGTCQPVEGQGQATTSIRCICPTGFIGQYCEDQEDSCNVKFLTSEGNLTYPLSSNNENYNHNANCMWWIRTPDRGKVLNITFTRFHLEGGYACSYDWLQIHDGFDSTAPLIGKFCGEELPKGGSIISTHESIFLWFRSDHSTTGLGFELNWNTTEASCGGTITGQSHGSLSSPGYPGNYPHNRDCLWSIVAPNFSKRIQLHFATLGIESHPNCSYDYLEIRDGLPDESNPGHLLGKYCNSTLPAPILSSGPYVSLRFHSDSDSSDTGFQVTFLEAPGVPGCGGTFTESSGIFASPQHPEPYPHGLDCEYLIRLPSMDERILLTFITFDLEPGPNCRYDFVEIRDGNRPDSPLIGRFCERNMPPITRSTSNNLLLRFRSDSSVTSGGFRVKYESICGGTYSEPTGILRSPYYPASYPRNRACIYIISQPVGKAIRLDFLDFEIEIGYSSRCVFDFVEIRDGDTENSTLVGHYCGGPTTTPDPIVTSFNYLWMKFQTDGSVQNRGFLANYSTFDISCGGILKEPHGVISSPGHPEVYPHGVECVWVVRGKPGQIIRLHWVTFSLERNARCNYDVVEVYDNSTLLSSNGSLIGRYCGQTLPPTITSSDYTLTIKFKSDHSLAHEGFMANYVLLNSSTICGGNYFTEYGIINSPNYPNSYPSGKNCIWSIRVPVGKQIRLNITDFDMEGGVESRGCTYDYLEIRNGGLDTSPLIGKFCGGDTFAPPTIIPSFSNSMFLKFVSDSSGSGRGFKIFWDGTTTGCGGRISSPSGSIVSPNYPDSTGTRVECVWTINGNQGSFIQFVFVDLDVQRSTTCFGEHVEIRDGPDATSPLIGKYCNAESLLALNSTSNVLRLKYISGYGSSGRGFHATYQTICSKDIRGHTGIIESPNFPNPYPHDRNCTWRIIAPLGNKVNMSFSHFSMEGPSFNSCRFDSLEISETSTLTPNGPFTSLTKLCGNANIPSLIASTKDLVIVNFQSDSSLAHNGFRMEWVINGCGGRIIGPYGSLSSPNYPRPYPNMVECEWKITTDLGTKVVLNVDDLDLEKADNCVYDHLKVYNGPDNTSPLLSHLCRKPDHPLVLTAHGNNMYVYFRSDSSMVGKGFYGWISQSAGGCGGRFTAPTGFIYSPNYPNNYDHDDDCGYLIRVADNHVVKLTWMDFKLERHSNCSYDFVSIHDGSTQRDPIIATLCDDTLPDPQVIRSTGSFMYIRFKTDGSSAAKGFKANYTTDCGARITGRSSGEITSPDYPHMIYSLNCTWFIQGTDPSDRVTLTFTHLDLQHSGSDPAASTTQITQESTACTKNYVEVFDGQDQEAPSIGKYCMTRVPPAITSSSNSLVIHVLTESALGYGFRAIYDTSSGACGGTLTSAEGSFMTPNFPNGYPINAECIWTIEASAGNRVSLTFRRFEIEQNDFCNVDFIEIRERSSTGPLLGHFCGTEAPNNITANGILWILFRTNGEGQAPGFLADYSLMHGNELSGPTGVIESPLYPLPFHSPTPTTHTWRIFVNNSEAIRITFEAFDLGFDFNNGRCNSLTIYDGFDETTGTELLRSCLQTIPEPVVTTGNVAFISLVKIYGYTNSLFRLRWEQIPLEHARNISASRNPQSSNITGCGGTIELIDSNSNITTLTSPGYRYPGYPADMRCEWIINTTPYNKIQLKVEDIEIEATFNCNYDKVEVYDGQHGTSNYILNKTLCQRSDKDLILTSTGSTMKLVMITDSSVTHPGFNFSFTTQCGGYIKSSRGRLTSPNFPNNYAHSQCQWILNARTGRTIKISFQTMDIYRGSGGGTECSTDQLILRNGGHPDSPFLGNGRYCGNTLPGDVESSGNQVLVTFNSWTSGGRGFALIFEEVSLACGDQIRLTDDAPSYVLSSPNFPNVPPPYSSCEWIFTVPSAEAVQLDFQLSFSFQGSPSCGDEGVEIRDGGTLLSPLIGKFCGDMPGTQKSTGNILYVRYYSNINEPRSGFKAQASIAKCGGTLTGWYGTIQSPGYPRSYETNLDCLWTIRGPSGSSLAISITELDVSPGPTVNNGSTVSCTKDWLRVTEENVTGIDFPRNWTYCTPTWDRVQSSSNEIHVIFHSDGLQDSNKKGFELNFRASTERCGGNLASPTGEIQSVGYPRAYPNYRSCMWKITAPLDRRIRLEFIDFDLEEKIITPTRSYCVDYIKVGQGQGYYTFAPFYNSTICGGSLPPSVESTSNEIMIRFRTDGSVAHRGFKARYTTDLPILCGGELMADQGTIVNPDQRTGTPNTTTSIYCIWKHTSGNENSTTIITINDLKIPPWRTQSDPNCVNGAIYAKGSTGYGSSSRKYCGQTLSAGPKIYIPGSYFELYYEATHWESSFNVSYQIIPCGGVITTGTNSTITSPGFPNTYAPNIECIWILQYSIGGQIQVTFTDLDLDDHRDASGCDRDWIILRNGRYPSSPVLGKYCGTNMPPNIVTVGSDLWVEFHTDGNGDGNKRGFRIETEVTTSGCGGTIHQKLGQIRSPSTRRGFSRSGTSVGDKYPNNAECEWIIETVPGYTINYFFTGRFDLETSTNCSNDFVQTFVKDYRASPSGDWVSLGRLCGKNLPVGVNLTTSSLRVLFRSNGDVNGDGFTLKWYSVCGGVFTEPSGLIRSAHYDRYNHSYHLSHGRFSSWEGWENKYKVQQCDYSIQANNQNDFIVLEFQQPFEVVAPFDSVSPTELSRNCPVVNVSLYEGTRQQFKLSPWMVRYLGIYCGTEVPRALIATREVIISYNYVAYFENYGFTIKYDIYACGGNITQPGTIQSPGHPFTYAPHMNCTWSIRAPAGKVVRFKFVKLELEQSARCQYDSVSLFNGERIQDDQKIGTFCGNLTQDFRRISSTGSAMIVQFQSDISEHFKGFLGAIDFTIGPANGCGGVINATSGQQNLRSPDANNDGKYDSYLDCQWLVVGRDFQSIELQFQSFVLEGNRIKSGTSRQTITQDQCPFDYVEIRDGPGPDAYLLGRYCGSQIPPRISSSGNFMWINFVSDDTFELSGFRATVNSRPSPCGTSFVLNATREVQTLRSPGFPTSYPANLRCRWTIDGARFNDEVDIKFVDLNIESSQECGKDALEIRDVATSYTSPEGVTGPILFTGTRPRDWRFRHLGLQMDSIMQDFRYCGSQLPSDFFSIGRTVELIFETDSSGSGRGFSIEYKAAGCNRTFDNSQGRIFSPEWPTHSPIYMNCIIIIQGGNDSTISLYFNEFVLQDSPGCGEGFFEAREGSSASGQILGRYCGSTRPNPIFSRTNTLWINYVTRLHPSQGYDISYTTTTQGSGCGGDLFHTGGSITSPGYPSAANGTLQNFDCRWRLRVPGALKVQLEFPVFMITGNCTSTFLELYTMNSHELGAEPFIYTTFCPGDTPSIYTGQTDMVMIHYKTDGSNTGPGWRIVFKGVSPQVSQN